MAPADDVKKHGRPGFSAGVLVYIEFTWAGAAIYVAGGAPLGHVGVWA